MPKIMFLLFTTIFSLKTSFIKYEEEGTTGFLSPKSIAINSQVLDELDIILYNIDSNKIRGEGEKSFVTGQDITEMSTLTKKQSEEFSKKEMIFSEKLKISIFL